MFAYYVRCYFNFDFRCDYSCYKVSYTVVRYSKMIDVIKFFAICHVSYYYSVQGMSTSPWEVWTLFVNSYAKIWTYLAIGYEQLWLSGMKTRQSSMYTMTVGYEYFWQLDLITLPVRYEHHWLLDLNCNISRQGVTDRYLLHPSNSPPIYVANKRE